MKRLSILAMLIASLLVLSGVAIAQESAKYEVTSVKINGDLFNANDFAGATSTRISVERGQKLKVEVRLKAFTDLKDVTVRAGITGYRYADHDSDKVLSTSKTFNLEENESKKKTLTLEVPMRLDIGEDIALRLQVYSSKTAAVFEQTYTLNPEGVANDNAISIKDVFLTPENSIKAGRYLLSQVKAKNYGDEDLEDITYKFSIPALGLSDRDDANEIEEDRSRTSEDLIVQIPQCTEAGTYKWTATVEWDDGDHFATKEGTIDIEASEACQQASGLPTSERTLITVGATSANVASGQAATYPVTVTNQGSESKTYTVGVDGTADWASTRVDPTNTVVLTAGETKTLYVYVTPTEGAAEGQKAFTATISSGSEVLQQLALTATVSGEGSAASGSKATEALKIGLVVLVVLFVILALIVGFNKLKGSDDDEDMEEGQTYY